MIKTKLAPRTGVKKRKRISAARVQRAGVGFIIFLLLLSLSYVVLFPFFARLSSALMSRSDLYDTTVSLIPRHATFDNFIYILTGEDFIKSLLNTVFYAFAVGIISVVSSTLIGYGFACYKFKTVGIWLILLLFTMLVPSVTTAVPLYSTFRYFDIFGIFGAVFGEPLTLTGTPVPLILLSATGLGFRGGIHVVLMRQYFKGMPRELTEAAFVDGAGHFKTFLLIIAPMARAMMIVVFVLSFSWQWSDTWFADILYSGQPLLPRLARLLATTNNQDSEMYISFVRANTAALIIIAPLIVFFLIFQRQIIAGIERAGITG